MEKSGSETVSRHESHNQYLSVAFIGALQEQYWKLSKFLFLAYKAFT